MWNFYFTEKVTGMLGCKSNNTPIDPNLKLDENANGIPVNKGSYQRLVGKLIYLCQLSEPVYACTS